MSLILSEESTEVYLKHSFLEVVSCRQDLQSIKALQCTVSSINRESTRARLRVRAASILMPRAI